MKKIILIITTILIGISVFAKKNENEKEIDLKGKLGFTTSTPVQVQVVNSTVTTTFNKDVDNVTITVKKKSTNQVISNQRMDAKQFDTVPVRINDYKEGDYSIEISSPEGELEGDF